MLWQRRGTILAPAPQIGVTRSLDLSSETNRQAVVDDLVTFTATKGLNGSAKDEIAQDFAKHLGFDYQEFRTSRILSVMSPEEIAELSAEGVDFQLHTHRHRTPNDEVLFRKEIRDNRKRLEEITGRPATHFCYPSGVYRMEFLPWLRAEGDTSATICEASLASRNSNALLLPRFVDTRAKTVWEFESWLDVTGSFLARRPASAGMNHDTASVPG